MSSPTAWTTTSRSGCSVCSPRTRSRRPGDASSGSCASARSPSPGRGGVPSRGRRSEAGVTDRVAQILSDAGCTGSLCAQALEGGRTVELEADRPMTPASVIKVPIALTVLSRIADGRLDGRARVVLPATRRTPGPVGISLMDDDVEMSLRDLTSLMLTISDNVATDALVDAVGIDAVNDLLAGLGLTDSVLVSDLRTMLDAMAVEAGFSDYAALVAYEPSAPGDPDADEVRRRLASTAALDPARGSRTTARQSVRLLQAIWRDDAG